MLASWSYNQVCLIWQVCLLVKYNIKVKTVCVCVLFLIKECVMLIMCCCQWRNWYWYIYDALADTMSLKWLSQLFQEWQQWFRFWGILSQYLTFITGSKTVLDLSAGSTYSWVYTVGRYLPFPHQTGPTYTWYMENMSLTKKLLSYFLLFAPYVEKLIVYLLQAITICPFPQNDSMKQHLLAKCFGELQR